MPADCARIGWFSGIYQVSLAMLAKLHPRNILYILDEIDQMPESYRLDRAASLRRVMIILSTVAVSLLLMNYLKNSSVLREILYPQ